MGLVAGLADDVETDRHAVGEAAGDAGGSLAAHVDGEGVGYVAEMWRQPLAADLLGRPAQRGMPPWAWWGSSAGHNSSSSSSNRSLTRLTWWRAWAKTAPLVALPCSRL